MKRGHRLSVAVAGFVIGGCVEGPAAPDGTWSQQFAVRAATERGGHLVEFNGHPPRGFAATVAALGGRVLFMSERVGFAAVSGLSSQAAAQLGGHKGISGVYDDVAVQLKAEQKLLETATVFTPASVANPAGAVLFSWQWNMRAIEAHHAWAAGNLGSPDVTVAILDSGIDYDNLDMNGVVDLSRSASFVPSDDAFLATHFPGRHPVDDLNGHGTNVATQVSSNAIAFAGVNSRAKLIAVKVLGMDASGSLGAILSGLIWAAEQGADVANLSLGVDRGLDKRRLGIVVGIINRVVNYVNRQGMVLVAGAGNEARDMDHSGRLYEVFCESPHVVCVSATGPTASADPFEGPFANVDAPALSYTNFGKAINVAAPGGTTHGYVSSLCPRSLTVITPGGPVFPCLNIITAIGGAGTSQAAPHVAGLAAQLVSHLGKANPSAIVHAITRGADDLGAPGEDPFYGRGRINVAATLGN